MLSPTEWAIFIVLTLLLVAAWGFQLQLRHLLLIAKLRTKMDDIMVERMNNLEDLILRGSSFEQKERGSCEESGHIWNLPHTAEEPITCIVCGKVYPFSDTQQERSDLRENLNG